MMNQTRGTGRMGQIIFAVAGVAVLTLLCMGAVNTGPDGGSSSTVYNIFSTNSNTFITNVVRSLDLWTQDVVGDYTVLRPVDTARTIDHQMVSSNYYGIEVTLLPTNGAANLNFSVAGYFFNQATNSAAHTTYWGLGKYGVVGEADDSLSSLGSGDSAGVLGVSDGSFESQYGVVGYAKGTLNAQTNIGVKGIAVDGGSTGGRMIGGYFEVSPTSGVNPTPAVTTTAALVGNVLADYPILSLQTSGVPVLSVGADGDLDLIKGVGYSWMTTNGAAGKTIVTDGGSPQQLYWDFLTKIAAGTNITAVTNGGLVTVSVTDLTNTVYQLARIGPGTNNYIAKFNTVGGTNVGNSPIFSDRTNLVEQRPRADGGSFNVASTNNIYGRETSGGDTNWLQIVAGAAGSSESHHIRAMATGGANQRLGILLNDAVNVEPISNQLIGHGAGDLYPNTGSAGAGLQSLGHQNLPWLDVWASRVFGATGLSSGPQFGSGVGGAGFGLTTDNTMLQFFRSTGITAAFNKDRNTGQLMLDIADNGLGLGTGMSNIISGVRNSGILGLIQVSVTNNDATATPGSHGIMGVQGSGTDKGGGDVKVVGGPSTGTAKSGDVRVQTTEPAASTSSSLNSSFKDRTIVAARPVTLTESSATLVFNVALASGKFCGLRVMATTDADDGTDFQSVAETFTIAAVNKGGTVSTAVSSGSTVATITSSGTLTTTWTAVANGNSVDVKCNAVSSLTQTTLKTRWRVDLDGDGTLVTTLQ